MNWYEQNKKEWKEIIETVAAEEHRSAEMVEKDTLQSLFLRELSRSAVPFVFKGGTSLSKSYDLIERFSEDIDLSMNRKPTESEKRKIVSVITSAAERMGMVLTNSENVQTRHSFNKYVFEYESLFSDIPSELIVETSFFQAAFPVEVREVSSFVGRFCKERGILLPIPFRASVVNMQVQSLERTFIDKVFAVCDYRIQNMQDRDSRHLYDIAKILPAVEVTPEMNNLIIDVRKDRMLSGNNPSAQPQYNIPSMLKEIIRSRFYERDYNDITKKLLYEDVSYDEAIKNGIAKVVEMDLFQYRERPRNVEDSGMIR